MVIKPTPDVVRYHVIGDSHGIGTSQQGGLVEGLASVFSALGVASESIGTLVQTSGSEIGNDLFDPLAGGTGLKHSCVGGATSSGVLNGSASPVVSPLANVLSQTVKADLYVVTVGSNDSNDDANTAVYASILSKIFEFNPSAFVVMVGPGTSIGSTWAFVQPDTSRLANIRRMATVTLPYIDRKQAAITSFYGMYPWYSNSERGSGTNNTTVAGFFDTAHFRRGFYQLLAADVVAKFYGITLAKLLPWISDRGPFSRRVDAASATLSSSGTRSVVRPSSEGHVFVDLLTVRNNGANPATVTLQEEARDVSGNALGTPVLSAIDSVTLAAGATYQLARPLRLQIGSSIVATAVGTTPNVVVEARCTTAWIGSAP